MIDQSNQVGEAFIKLTVDGSEIKDDISLISREIKQELEGVSRQGDVSGERLTGAFKKSGDAIEQNTRKIVEFQAKLSAAIGVVTGITGAAALAASGFVKFGRSMLEAAKEAGRARDAIEGLRETIEKFDPTSAAANTSQLRVQYESLIDQIRAANLPLEETFRLWDQLDESFVKAKESARGIKFDEAQRSAAAAADAIKRIRDESRSAVSATQETDAAWREYSETIKEVNKQVQALRQAEEDLAGSGRAQEQNAILAQRITLQKQATEAANEELDLRLTMIAEEEQMRAKAIADQERMKDEAQRARDAESAARQVEAAQRAAQSFADALNGVFGADFTTRLDTIAGAIERNTNGLGRLK